MDAPTPIYPKFETPDGPQDNVIHKKEYEFKCENKLYKLQIQIDSYFIYFKINEILDDDIIPIIYKNKFDLKNIVSKLKLLPDIYDELIKVLLLLDDCYNDNKLKLSIKGKEVNIIAIIKNGNLEIECIINLIENKTEIDDKFEIIINDIKLLKNQLSNNKILEIENSLKKMQEYVNQKFEANEKTIKELTSKIEQYDSKFEKSENNVKILKNELLEMKEYLKKLMNSSDINKENKENDENEENKLKIVNNKNYEKNNTFNCSDNKYNDLENIGNTPLGNNNKDQIYIDEYPFIDSKDLNENIETYVEKELLINNEDYDNNKDKKKNSNLNFPKNLRQNLELERSQNPLFKSLAIHNKREKEEEFFFNKEDNNNYNSNKDITRFNRNNENNNLIRNDSYYSEITIEESFDMGGKNNIFKPFKNKYFEKKLSCIIESTDKPIPNIKNIPKFKIFKGFKTNKKSYK